jgi:uncharacterized protein DUF4238
VDTSAHRISPKEHHYTSQFLLRNFGDPHHYIWCYRQNGQPERRPIRRVAVETDYNTLLLPSGAVDREFAEARFSRLESTAAPLLNEIVAGDLPDRDGRVLVAMYLYVLRTSSPNYRLTFEDEGRAGVARHIQQLQAYVANGELDRLDRTLLELLDKCPPQHRIEAASRLLKDLRKPTPETQNLKNITVYATYGPNSPTLAPERFADMAWIIVRAPRTSPLGKKPNEFVISDNPVVLTVDCPSVLADPDEASPLPQLTVALTPSIALVLQPGAPDWKGIDGGSAVVRRINTRTVQWAYDEVFGSSLWPSFESFVSRNIGKNAFNFPEQKPGWFRSQL